MKWSGVCVAHAKQLNSVPSQSDNAYIHSYVCGILLDRQLLHRKEEGRLCPSPAPFGKEYVGMSMLSGSPADTTFSTFVFQSLIHTSERKARLRKSVIIRTSELVELLPYLCVTSKVNTALLIWGGLILFSFFVCFKKYILRLKLVKLFIWEIFSLNLRFLLLFFFLFVLFIWQGM